MKENTTLLFVGIKPSYAFLIGIEQLLIVFRFSRVFSLLITRLSFAFKQRKTIHWCSDYMVVLYEHFLWYVWDVLGFLCSWIDSNKLLIPTIWMVWHGLQFFRWIKVRWCHNHMLVWYLQWHHVKLFYIKSCWLATFPETF